MRKRITAFPLKLVAIVAMLLNHIGSGLYLYMASPGLFLFTETVGKLTFPIMAFLVAEGYRHTRDVKRYALRLAVFCLLSCVPFWLVFHPGRPFTWMELFNNIYFTLLMGLLAIHFGRTLPRLRILVVLVCALLTINSDWMLLGVLMIYGFYAIPGRAGRVVPIVFTMAGYIALLLYTAWAAPLGAAAQTELVRTALTFLGMLGAIPLLLCYNGQRGYSPPWVKWGFYLFYPAHLLVLWLVRIFILKL